MAHTYSIEDVFTIVHDALMAYYSDKTVTVEQEVEEGKEERMDVPMLEFIMHSIGHQIADRWASDKEEVLEDMHKALDPRDYGDFTFTIDKPTGLITFKSSGGGKKTRKSRRKSRRSSH